MKKITFHSLLVIFLLLIWANVLTAQSNQTVLRHSLKGYELYSWQAEKDWYFSLLPGTNRIKTRSEIIDSAQSRGKGVEELKRLIDRLPQGEEVSWVSHLVPKMPLPPQKIIREIWDYCQQRQIILRVNRILSGAKNDVVLLPNNPPGNIRLLAFYNHQTEQGIDTKVGKIWKEGGLLIRYDIGGLAGQYVEERGNYLWYKEQIIGGKTVKIALTKENQLLISFPQSSANFYADVKSSEDIADMLLMVLTY